MTGSLRANLRTFVRIAGPGIKRPLLGMTVLSILAAWFEVLGVGLVVPIIQLLSDPADMMNRPVVARLAGLSGMEDPRELSLVLCLGMAGAFLGKNAYMVLFAWIQSGIIMRWKQRTSTRLMAGYMAAPYLTMSSRNSAELIRNVGLCGVCFDGFLANFLQLMVNLIMVIGIITMLLAFQPMVTLVAGGILTVLMTLQYKGLGPLFVRLGKNATEAVRDRMKALQQGLGALKETRALGRAQLFVDAFAAAEQRTVANGRRTVFFGTLPALITETVLMISIFVVMLVVTFQIPNPSEALGQLALLAAAAFRMMPLLNRSMIAVNGIHQAQAALGVGDREMAAYGNVPPTPVSACPAEPVKLRQGIVLDGVTFRYPNVDHDALRNIQVAIAPGECIGLVGGSGAGKTTLADMLLGLIEPNEGRILIDGQPLATLSERWKRSLGYVPQDIYFVDDTLRRNVAFGIPDHLIDDDAIDHAIAAAHLADFVARLPAGLDTRLEESGRRLSGGQRQRIGIARALYHAPEILIMDEATSALDVETESQVTDTIRQFHGSKTMVIIAHRLSTVQHCDRLFLMRDGAIADTGTFAELAERNAEFRTLVTLSNVLGGIEQPQTEAAR